MVGLHPLRHILGGGNRSKQGETGCARAGHARQQTTRGGLERPEHIRDDRLKLTVFCCLNNLTTLTVEGRANYVTEFSPRDLVRFVSDDFIPMNEMCERASMTEREIYDRSKAVFEYFGFPFNAAPPT